MALQMTDVCAITFNTVDDDKAQSQTTFYSVLPSLVDWTKAAMLKTVELLWALVQPLTDAALTGFSVRFVGYDDTYPDALSGSDVEDKGVVLFDASGNVPGSFAIPSIKESLLVTSGLAAGIQVDVTDTDVDAFLTALTDGIDLSPFSILDTVRFTTSRGETIERIRDMYKQNRSSHKSRGRRG
jgi:hypothetical protein